MKKLTTFSINYRVTYIVIVIYFVKLLLRFKIVLNSKYNKHKFWFTFISKCKN